MLYILHPEVLMAHELDAPAACHHPSSLSWGKRTAARDLNVSETLASYGLFPNARPLATPQLSYTRQHRSFPLPTIIEVLDVCLQICFSALSPNLAMCCIIASCPASNQQPSKGGQIQALTLQD